MDWRKHFIYWIFPALVMLVLIGMYFSNVTWLMALLAPEVNRELGILEGVQNVLLLAILYLVGRRVAASEIQFERAFFIVALLGSLFMLLEEMDYGTHYWWMLNGWDMDTRPTMSAHNIDDDAYLDYYKKGGDVLMTLWFVILPWILIRMRSVWAAFLRPSRLLGLAFIVAVLVSDLAHYLSDNFPPDNHYLGRTIGEFRELFTYYIWLLYFGVLTRREWPGLVREGE